MSAVGSACRMGCGGRLVVSEAPKRIEGRRTIVRVLVCDRCRQAHGPAEATR